MQPQMWISVFLLIAATMAGCLAAEDFDPGDDEPATSEGSADIGSTVTDRHGNQITLAEGELGLPVNTTFLLSEVGERGPEPSVGITSSGCIFFTAMEKVMRSCDDGGSWERVDDMFNSPTSNDPYLWVDPGTDRVFNVQMGPLTHTWVAWSDDDGESWLGNPYNQGPLPVVDHIKLGSGPWTDEGYGLAGGESPLHATATYFCYNKLVGVFCYTSFDGGMSFPIGGQVFGMAGSGGLHGAITSAPDGTVYVPPRLSTPTLYMSKDNGLTWTSATMGEDVGTPSPRKNTEVGTDSESNAYHVWVGEDTGVYMSRSTDSGGSWEQESIRVSPNDTVSATFPHIDAGDPGRIAVAYLASSVDLDDHEDWDGNPHDAPDDVEYDLYVTISLNALDDEPVFHTFKVTEDPVQVGSICISSGSCVGGNRNLLDFNDLHIDQDGRVYVAYADGCTGECASGEARSPENSRDAAGMLAILEMGPSLFEDVEFVDLSSDDGSS